MTPCDISCYVNTLFSPLGPVFSSKQCVEQILLDKLREGVPALLNELQLTRCLFTHASADTSRNDAFSHGLSLLCLNSQAYAEFPDQKSDLIEQYADAAEVISDLEVFHTRVARRIERLHFDDSELWRSSEELACHSTAQTHMELTQVDKSEREASVLTQIIQHQQSSRDLKKNY